MVTVRPAEAEDVAAIQRVARRTWHAAYDDILGPDAVDATVDEWYAVDTVTESVTDDETTYLVATDDGVVGYAAAGPVDEETAALYAIYVRPDRWGDGVGTRLFEAVVDRLRDRGYGDLRISVLADNERARAFYERHGATPADRERVELAGVTVAEVTYERDL